ncbi:MAG: hypothetical protein K2L97_06905 [Muribaculaceae bacterium]|nr:hypothetical protein [Muribaculaceae bacterium]
MTLASFSGNNDKKEQATDQEAPQMTKVEGDKFTPTTNIRYYKNLQARAQQEALRQQQEFLDSIDNFLTSYNRDKHYSRHHRRCNRRPQCPL